MDSKLEVQPQPNEQALIGTWRRIGVTGPVYQVVGVGSGSPSDGLMMTIQLPETGELVDYSLKAILDDPEEL